MHTATVEDKQMLDCKWDRIEDVTETKLFLERYKKEAHKDSLFFPTVAQQYTLLRNLYNDQYTSYTGEKYFPKDYHKSYLQQ